MSPRARDLPLHDVLLLQRDACAQGGSPLYARLLQAMADDVAEAGLCGQILHDHAEDALAQAVALRFLGTLHRIVLEGREPGLGRYYPSVGGDPAGDPVPAFFAAVRRHRDEIERGLASGVQTNESGRAAALVGGLHAAAARYGLPLRVLEVGSSAGLLLRWDRFAYDTGRDRWGDEASPVRFGPDSWVGAPPALHGPTVVAERRGCDVHPIDPTTDEGAGLLRSYLWPDQVERRRRLDAAIEVARRVPVTVDRADAGEWVEAQLAEPREGVTTVVHHSIVLQYLPRPSLERMRSAIAGAGARATPTAPLVWLRMEPAGPVADVRWNAWPGGADEVLATTGYHGPPVRWGPAAASAG